MSGHELFVDGRAVGADCAAAAGPRSHQGRPGPGQPPFVEAVLWLLRNGCCWRALPAVWGHWHTTYTRFQRWTAAGVWVRMLAAVQQEDALHTLLVGSTTVRAHQHASGGRTKSQMLPDFSALIVYRNGGIYSPLALHKLDCLTNQRPQKEPRQQLACPCPKLKRPSGHMAGRTFLRGCPSVLPLLKWD